MNKFMLQGFMDGIEKRAGLSNFLTQAVGGAMIGAPARAGIAYAEEDDPNYKRALIRGAIEGAVTATVLNKLRHDLRGIVDENLTNYVAGMRSVG